MKALEILWDGVLIGVPPMLVFWAWYRRIRKPGTWREHILLLALVVTTVNLALYLALMCLNGWFGAKTGSGVAQWERAGTLIVSGFWLSAATFLLAVIGSGKPIRRLLLVLSLVGAVFWTMVAIPASDFLFVERAQQQTVQATR